jgi:hypothetical protein
MTQKKALSGKAMPESAQNDHSATYAQTPRKPQAVASPEIQGFLLDILCDVMPYS